MKAKQLKNGTFTISEISTEQMEAIYKVMNFAKCAEMAYANHPQEEKEAIDKLRKDGDTIEIADQFRSFLDFILETKL